MPHEKYEELIAFRNIKDYNIIFPVDLGIFDATIGFVDGDVRVFEHNNLNMVIEMKKTLEKNIKILHKSYGIYASR